MLRNRLIVMKKVVLYILGALILGACAETDKLPVTGETDKVRITFGVSMPGYKAVTRADNNIPSDLFLLAFDSHGLYIERVQATVPTRPADGTRTFTADVPTDTKYIHSVATSGCTDWRCISEQ